MTDKPAWFAARLLFESNHDLFEEKIVLVRSASGVADAEDKARKLGKRANHEYKNVDGETVSWRFAEVLDIMELDETEINDGSEVYHHFLAPDEVEQIRQSLKSGSLAG